MIFFHASQTGGKQKTRVWFLLTQARMGEKRRSDNDFVDASQTGGKQMKRQQFFPRKPDWGKTEKLTMIFLTASQTGDKKRSVYKNLDASQTGRKQKKRQFWRKTDWGATEVWKFWRKPDWGKTEKARMIFLTQASLGKNRRSVYELFNASQATPGVPMQPVTETGVVLYSADLNGGVEIDKPTRETLQHVQNILN